MYTEKQYNENLQRYIFDGVGKYGIPEIHPETIENETKFIGFNYLKSCKNRKGKSVHFFLDDYQFTRLWNNPDRYVDMLKECDYVLSPDFSLYTDYPVAMQIYNHYRKHWIGAYLQLFGIKVIPTIAWGTPDSYEWCFDGEPKGGVVAVSSVGCMKDKECEKLFLKGYNEMIKRLEPKQILFYGKVPDGCEGNILNIESFTQELRERVTKGETK